MIGQKATELADDDLSFEVEYDDQGKPICPLCEEGRLVMLTEEPYAVCSHCDYRFEVGYR